MATPPNTLPSAPEDSHDFAPGAISPQTEDVKTTSPTTTNPPRLPSLRSVSDPPTTSSMTASSTPLGMLSSARKPPGSNMNTRGPPPRGGLPESMEAKMKAFHLSRQGAPPTRPQAGTHISTGAVPDVQSPGSPTPGLAGNLRLPPNLRPAAHNFVSAPAVPKAKAGLSARRGLKLPGGLPGTASPTASPQSDTNGSNNTTNSDSSGSLFSKYSDIVDTKTGTLNFKGKAVIHGGGIDFSSGSTFSISLDEVDTLEELGKGNYGTVYKVRHARPKIRRPGLGLAGNRTVSSHSINSSSPDGETDTSSPKDGSTTGVIMAMKELRLELDEAKFAAIIMELDILHRCLSPYIIDFYGAFFQEGAVYICIEYMDGGSLDEIYGDGIPESVLRKITYATTMGLKTLKDDHNIIHRDVKPTNILVNTRGQVKICDFGVSGNLVASIAKTNIGCQSYMAPERISGGGMSQAGANPGGGTYSVQSDIWSLGLSIIECAMGRYPYPPETYNNIFSQLSAIVDGDPPDLPTEGYSPLAREFVRGCLNKIPKMRPTYSALLAHPWLASLSKIGAIVEEDEDAEEGAEVDLGMGVGGGSSGTEDKEVADWVCRSMERKRKGLMGQASKPALHAAPLVSPGVNAGVGAGAGAG